MVALIVLPAAAHAQTFNPRIVSFIPSDEHDAVTNGQAVVSGYEMEFFQGGRSQPLLVTSLGKPSPAADGYIYVDFMNLIGAPPLTGVPLEARVAAVGPLGRAESDASNLFLFEAPGGCSASVTPGVVTGPAQGGTATIDVTIAGGCAWQASSGESWVTVAGPSSGSGTGKVLFTVTANAGADARTGTVLVAGQPVTVIQEGTRPLVRITSPASGEMLRFPANVEMSADVIGTREPLAWVGYYVNGTLVGKASASPYKITWKVRSAGTCSITALVMTASGVQATSSPVTISIAMPRGATREVPAGAKTTGAAKPRGGQ